MSKEIDSLTEKLIAKILSDPKARKLAEEFIRRNSTEEVSG